MRNPCKIIQDLLPLYKDDICSEETREFVENHIKNCETCRVELQHMSEEIAEQHRYIGDEKIAKAVSVAWKRKNRVSTTKGFIIAVLIVLMVVNLFYVPYTKMGMRTTVRICEKQMTSFAESRLSDGVKSESILMGYKVSAYPNSKCVFFAHRGMDYDGLFYSASGELVGFQGTEAVFVKHGKGWIWKETDGDNWMYVEQITENWFWYEMHF